MIADSSLAPHDRAPAFRRQMEALVATVWRTPPADVTDGWQRDSDLEARLDELASLDDGWLDGRGSGTDAEVVSAVRTMLRFYVIEGVAPTPHVYPDADGGLQVELTLGPLEIEFGVTSAHSICVLACDTTNPDLDGDFEQELHVNEPADWADLGRRLARFVAELRKLVQAPSAP